MQVPFINFEYEYEQFENEYNILLKDHILQGQFIGGNSVKDFENNLKNYLGAKYVVTVGNGTDALKIALESLELERKEVIVPAFSFFATSEAIVQAGLKPVFVDVEIKDCNIDVEKIEEKINNDTGAILPVHLFGNSSNMEKIIKIARKYNLKIIEDVAQSFGTEFENKKLGTLGDAGCYSFFPTKTLGAYGDGGAIATNSSEIFERANMLKNHGTKKKYFNEVFGHNSRLDSIQASVLNYKPTIIDQWIQNRITIGKFYDESFKDIDNLITLENVNSTFNYYSILIKNNKRDSLKQFLDSKQISTSIYYPITLPALPAHNIKEEFTVAEQICKEIISLPIWPGINNDQLEYVVNTVKEFYR